MTIEHAALPRPCRTWAAEKSSPTLHEFSDPLPSEEHLEAMREGGAKR